MPAELLGERAGVRGEEQRRPPGRRPGAPARGPGRGSRTCPRVTRPVAVLDEDEDVVAHDAAPVFVSPRSARIATIRVAIAAASPSIISACPPAFGTAIDSTINPPPSRPAGASSVSIVAGLHQLADAADRRVAGRLARGLDAEHGGQIDLELGDQSAGVLLVRGHRRPVRADGDVGHDADMRQPELGREERAELAVEVVDRLHADEDEVMADRAKRRRERRRRSRACRASARTTRP